MSDPVTRPSVNDLPSVVEQLSDGQIVIKGHRITLQDVLWHYNEGWSAEMLAHNFPTLKLSDIHHVLAFYLERQADLDAYLAREAERINLQREAGHKGPSIGELRKRLAKRQAG